MAVLGLGLYGLWPMITGQTSEDAAREDVEAPSSEAAVDVVVAERVDFPLRTQASGHLRPWQQATLHAEASGQVTELAVQEGSRVEEGEVLARLDNQEERIALKEARAEFLKARAEFKAKYGGERTLTTSSDSAFLENPKRAASEREATQRAVSGLTAARQAVARARLKLERTRITAPFAGRVADLKGREREETGLSEGQYVSSGQQICTLLQTRRMKVEVDVLESDLVHVREGASVQVHVPALGPAGDSTAVFEGRVWAVNPQVERQSGTGRVTVSIPNPKDRLVSGLYAKVRLETKRLTDRLVVPDEAVLVRQGRDLVFVVEGGHAQWTYVNLGARSGDYVEITKGAQPGDSIAVDGHFALAHDAPVNIDEVTPLGLD